ncbi:MAG: hypothetical protein O2783_06065 [Chloroflexi bacterium]|nr:hypothetical protein [Chloroflexota bacterium]
MQMFKKVALSDVLGIVIVGLLIQIILYGHDHQNPSHGPSNVT